MATHLAETEKEFFHLERELYLNTTYAPPAISPYTKSLDYDIVEKLEEEIIRYGVEGNVIMGWCL